MNIMYVFRFIFHLLIYENNVLSKTVNNLFYFSKWFYVIIFLEKL